MEDLKDWYHTTLAFDRMQEVELLTQTYQVKFINFDLFKNVIGINYTDKIETVVLWFDAWQGNYIKNLWLHPSQKIISDDQTGLVISLELSINFELKQMIKSYGSAVKVLEPLHLKNEILEDLKKTLANY